MDCCSNDGVVWSGCGVGVGCDECDTQRSDITDADTARASCFELLIEFGFADIDVLACKGTLEEGSPEIIEPITEGDGEHAFVLEAARGGEHLEIEGEEHFADGVQTARDVGVFAVEGDGGVVASNGLERSAGENEVAALDHGANAENVLGRVGEPGDAIEDIHEPALTRCEVVVDERTGERNERTGFVFVIASFVIVERDEDLFDPAESQAGVGVNVGDERAGGGEKAGLARIRQTFAQLVDHAHARSVVRDIAESDLASAVSASVVNDDDLGDVLKAASLIEDGFEASAR